MATRHTSGAFQALYRVFVLPSLSRTPSSLQLGPKHASLKARPSRPLSTTPLRYAKNTPQETRTERWDEEITARTIYLIDPKTGSLLHEPRTRFDILNSLDRETHRLVQVPGERHGLPICKIVNKREAYEHSKRQKEAAKEKKKTEVASKSVKTLELNWAMDSNDLGHRLDRIKEFLSEGRRVEVILASKKRGRKASVEECQAVLQKIRRTVDEVDGAKEAKSMEGKVGGFATLFFRGKPQLQQPAQERGS